MYLYLQFLLSDEIMDVQVAHDIGRLVQLDYGRERAVDARQVYRSIHESTGKRPYVRPYCCGDRFGCCCPCICKSIDALDYYENEIAILERQYDEEKNIAFEQKNLGMAFITFRKKRSMIKIIYEHAKMSNLLSKKKANEMSSKAADLHADKWTVLVAPSPNNICWENLGTSPIVWWLRAFILNAATVCVMIFFSTPAYILGALDRLHARDFLLELPAFGGLIYQMVGTWLLWLFAVLLPVLVYYVGWFEGHWTKSMFNHSVLLRSYIFLLTMLLFLPSISLTSFVRVAEFFKDDNKDQQKLR
jgi:hypothetical protein